jgi:hypothetical protein
MSINALSDKLELEPGEEKLLRVENAIEGAKGSCVIYFTNVRLFVKPDPAKTNESIKSMKRLPLMIVGLLVLYTMVINPLFCAMFVAPPIQVMPESTTLLLIRGVGIVLIALVLFLYANPIGEKSTQVKAEAGYEIRYAEIKKALLKKRTIEYPALSYCKLRLEMADGVSRFDFGLPLVHFNESHSILTKALPGRIEVK